MNCEEIKNIIVKFIHDKVGESGLSKVVIGISGGIDSAVITTLAVEALGKDRVIGIMMPKSMMDTTDNINYIDAKNLAISLGIYNFTMPVDKFINKDCLDIMRNTLPDNKERKVRIGNILARGRMIILYDQAMFRNALVLGTTNKTELLLGYFTKHGDGAVDIEPIADLYKTEIFKLAKYIGVPDSIINKAPSADLWENQTDEDELDLRYEEIDQILWWLIEEQYNVKNLSENLEKLTGIKDKKVLEKVLTIMSKNYHKTAQPPICKIEDDNIRTQLSLKR